MCAKRGLEPLFAPSSLARAAARKSGDILRCDEFNHEACGREFTYWIERVGYKGCGWAENIAYGTGSLATPRSIFRGWMNSSGHRRNILGAYDDPFCSETPCGSRMAACSMPSTSGTETSFAPPS